MSHTISYLEKTKQHYENLIKKIEDKIVLLKDSDPNEVLLEILEFYSKNNFFFQDDQIVECKGKGDLTFEIAPVGTYANKLMSEFNEKRTCDKKLLEAVNFYKNADKFAKVQDKEIVEAWDDGWQGICKDFGWHARTALKTYKDNLMRA